jgi:hypothetical protein
MPSNDFDKKIETSASVSLEEPISVRELIVLLSRLVPDEPKPSEIMYEISDNEREAGPHPGSDPQAPRGESRE